MRYPNIRSLSESDNNENLPQERTQEEGGTEVEGEGEAVRGRERAGEEGEGGTEGEEGGRREGRNSSPCCLVFP